MKKPSFTPFPELSTNRITLRCIRLEDAKHLYLLRTSEENSLYLDLEIPNSMSDSLAKVKRLLADIADNKSIFWMIERNDDRSVLGTLCLWNLNIDTATAELGYELLPAHKGQGYMTEALTRIISYAVKDLGFSRLQAYTNKDNAASCKLLEKFDFEIVGHKADIHSQSQQPYVNVIYAKSYE